MKLWTGEEEEEEESSGDSGWEDRRENTDDGENKGINGKERDWEIEWMNKEVKHRKKGKQWGSTTPPFPVCTYVFVCDTWYKYQYSLCCVLPNLNKPFSES